MAVTTVSTFDVCTVTWYGRTQASKYSRRVAGASGVSNACVDRPQVPAPVSRPASGGPVACAQE